MTESFPLKIGNKSRISTLTTAIQHCTGGSNRPIKQEKEIKGIQIGKKKAKLSLSAGELILHIQTLKEHTHTHACTHIHTLLHTLLQTHTHSDTHTHTHIYKLVHTDTHTLTDTHTHTL